MKWNTESIEKISETVFRVMSSEFVEERTDYLRFTMNYEPYLL